MSDRPPNIILIQADQWRGDCLSIDGHPIVHTPYLDQLATDGCLFTRAYSATPVCIPAGAALMTGLTQRSHRRVGYLDGVPWDYPVTLAGEFSRHGFQTHCVGKLHAHPAINKLGFESVELHDGYLHFARDRSKPGYLEHDDYIAWLRQQTGRPDADDFEHGLNCNSVVARPWPLEERLHPTNWCVSRAIRFLEQRDVSRPYFLYVSFHRPHPPYDPPAWAFDQYMDMPMDAPPVGDWVDTFAQFEKSARPDANVARYRSDVLRRARAGYYGHMTHIDHQINRLLETLYEFREPCWICFTSDHGEMMGDHHFYRKGMPYEGSSRVPLILRAPLGSAFPSGRSSSVLVEQRDIMPTLLECANLPIPEKLEGRSFLAHARSAAAPLREYLHGELTILGQSVQWVTDGEEKYVWLSATGTEQLFDLRNDPTELHDLARDESERSRERRAFWRTRLVAELTGRPEGFVDGDRLVAGRKPMPLLP